MTAPSWEQQKIRIPKKFAGQVPLFQVIDSYFLAGQRESIKVDRVFYNCQERTRICYNGPKLTERVLVENGKIVSVDSRVAVRFSTMPNLHTRRGRELLQRMFTPPPTPTPTYHNIKRYERELLELPYQEDIQAIYQGTGEFI